MIEVVDLQKSYGDKTALRGISFNVKKGEFFGFLGPNGAGKSTTIKLLTGQLLPSHGRAHIMGLDAFKQKEELHSIIGIVPEQTNLYERLTVSQNLEFFCRLYSCDIKKADRYIELVKLGSEKKTVVKKLSKGMKQRVLLIRALLHNPSVLFLDEPTSGLDPSSANDIHCLLQKLNGEGVTIFLTSHNMEEVEKLCHRVAFIDNGIIAETGTPQELKLKYTDNRLKVLLQNGGVLEEKIIPIAGEESSRLVAGWMQEGVIKSMHSLEPTLAEIFMKVTGRELV